MDINKADELLKSYSAGTCTAEERQLIEGWYDEIVKFEEKNPDLSQESFVDTVLRERLKHYLHKEALKQPRHRLRMLVVAAAALLAVFSVYYFYNSRMIESSAYESEFQVNHKQDSEFHGATLKLADGETIQLRNDQGIVIDTFSLAYSDGSKILSRKINDEVSPLLELNTPKGGQYQIDLSDGSRVWLNANSTLNFPNEFGDSERRVELVGEAYFEIAHDERKPFKVVTNFSFEQGQVIEVLGTKFNINAYKENQVIKTTLLEGSVKVRALAFDVSKILMPSQQSVISSESQGVVTKEVNVENVMAWRNGDFVFDDEDLESIMHKVSQWYDVDVSYDYKPRELNFNGAISRSRELTAVLQALAETGEVDFKVTGKKITVKRGKQKR